MMGDYTVTERPQAKAAIRMPCSKHRQLELDLEQAVAALDRLTYLETSNPNAARGDTFGSLAELLPKARYRLRMHVAARQNSTVGAFFSFLLANLPPLHHSIVLRDGFKLRGVVH